MEAMWTRFIPLTVEVKRLIENSAIGRVRFFQADFGYATDRGAEGRALNPDLGGGALLDVGIYPISFASMVFGAKPGKITSQAQIGDSGVDEQSSYLFTYDDDQLAVLSSAVTVKSPGRAVITGDDGMIKIEPPFHRAEKATIITGDNKETVIEKPIEGNGYNYQAVEVGNCLRGGKLQSEIMSLAETLAIMETMDQIRGQWGLQYPCE
jgi:predicted dehydrogenase